jgi:hypothetical protein
MQLKTFEEFLNESVDWKQGGYIFLLGKPQKGQKNLYIVSVKSISTLQRANVAAEMVTLYDEIHQVTEEDGRLVAKKIMYDQKLLKNTIGLSGMNVVLNKNKTPYWRYTIKETDMNKVLREAYTLVKNLKDVKL